MEKDVLISIRGLQYLMDEESGEQEPVEVMTTGSYYKKNGESVCREKTEQKYS